MKKAIIPLLAMALLGFGCYQNNGTASQEKVDQKLAEAPLETIQPSTPAQPAEKPEEKSDEIVVKPGPEVSDDDLTPVEFDPYYITHDLRQFARLNNDFAFRLYEHSLKEGKNLFFSPYSISTALSMAYAGAKKGTADEMVKALSFEMPPGVHHKQFQELGSMLNSIGKRKKAQLHVANGLFQSAVFENLLLPEYDKLLRENYDSSIQSLNFSEAEKTAKYINDWVLARTNDRIKDLISKENIEDSNDGLVLVNAIFFKGNWQKQFNPDATQKMPFYTKPGRNEDSARPVMMMNQKSRLGYFEFPGGQVLEIPYEEEDLAMMILLPDENSKTQPVLNLENYQKWSDALRYQEVIVYLPRFTLDLSLEGLVDNLKNMGMRQAFSAKDADFTGIRDPKGGADLYIDDVIHKAFIEVNEEGTEAAAATAVVMATKSAALPDKAPPIFLADHPFTYMIVHKPSGAVLFLGKLNDPPEL